MLLAGVLERPYVLATEVFHASETVGKPLHVVNQGREC